MNENKNVGHLFAYIAGIIDGEGCVTYTQRLEHRKGKPRAYKYWNIRIEVAMTHKETIEYLHETLGCGHVNIRPRMSHQNFDQWRWRCSHRDAYEVAKAIEPFSLTKKEKLRKVIKHYEES
jgi:hypothetical protein